MKSEFMKIFWGLVIVAVDVSITEFDLFLPDIVGYGLIYHALSKLTPVNSHFAKARPYAVVAALVWLVAIFRIVPPAATTIASILLDLAVIWYVCTGIMLLALERANADLAETAVMRRNWTAALSGINVFVVLTALSVGNVVHVLIVPLVMVSLAIGFLVLTLIVRASHEII